MRSSGKQLFEAAIHFCENGAPVPQIVPYHLKRDLDLLRDPRSAWRSGERAAHLRARRARAPEKGELFSNPDLARTYRAIADGGREEFTKGGSLAPSTAIQTHRRVADPRRILSDPARGVGRAPRQPPIGGSMSTPWAANTQGLATLQMLNMLENFDLCSMGFQSSASIHVQAEAKRLAFEDRARYYADPHFSDIPLGWLSSKAYAAERAKLIRPDRIPRRSIRARPRGGRHDLPISVADASGMMVSMIQSNYRGMGSGSRCGRSRIHVPGPRPTVFARGRPLEPVSARQTAVPDHHSGFAARSAAPWLSFWRHGRRHAAARPGPNHLQPRRLWSGCAGCGNSPRWHHVGSSQSMGEDAPELGMPAAVSWKPVSQAARARSRVSAGPGPRPGSFGRYQCIELGTSGSEGLAAASEMRADGVALAY